MSYQDYFTREQHRFMIACTDTLIECDWDYEEAFDEAKEALDAWEYADEIPTSPDSLKFGKVSFDVKGKRCEIFYTECRQYSGGQRHMRTYHRKTYVSSRWYTCHIEGMKSFRVKLVLGKEQECFQRAIHKVLDMIQVS